MGIRVRTVSARRVVIVLVLVLAGLLAAAVPGKGQQNQAALPALLLIRLKLYSKAPVA